MQHADLNPLHCEQHSSLNAFAHMVDSVLLRVAAASCFPLEPEEGALHRAASALQAVPVRFLTEATAVDRSSRWRAGQPAAEPLGQRAAYRAADRTAELLALLLTAQQIQRSAVLLTAAN